MPFQKLQQFTQKVSDLSDKPTLSPIELKNVFDAAPEELRTYLNKLIDALTSTKSGDSGAKNIKATSITGLTGNDVQTLLEALKTQLDNTVIGSIPDGLYAKKADVDTHLNKSVTDSNGVHGLKMEQGSWTPRIDSTGTSINHSYTIREGSYVRVGKLVTIDFIIEINVKSASATGYATLTGLPFSMKSGTTPMVNIARFANVTLPSPRTQMGGGRSGSYIIFWASGSDTTSVTLDVSTHFKSGSEIRGSMTYEIA